MFKVLLVDDERIIREGISSTVPWEENGFQFTGAASSAVEAYKWISENPPHIVITDIKMPVMDGLELISKVKEIRPEIEFIILSGHGEFEFAKKAMQYGVKQYLLKPCNENRIIEVLNQVKEELEQKIQKEAFMKENRERLNKVIPLVKEQFFRDYIMNKTYSAEDYDYFSRLLRIDCSSIRMVLMQPEGKYGYEELFALLRIWGETFEPEEVRLKTTINSQALIILKSMDEGRLLKVIDTIKESFKSYFGLEVTTVYSDISEFENMPYICKDIQECLQYKIYMGAGSVLSVEDLLVDNKYEGGNLPFDYDQVALAVKSGNSESVRLELDKFFRLLEENKVNINIAKSYCTELYMIIIRQSTGEAVGSYLKNSSKLKEMNSLEQFQGFIWKTAAEISTANYNTITTKYSKLVKTMMDHIHENLDKENLSLKWIAEEIMYVNVGYLSRLFNNEVGEKFPHYVTKLRMERAKELIKSCSDDRIYEVAEKIGLGNNPQYFSQLFKKYTGSTPKEYKKLCESMN